MRSTTGAATPPVCQAAVDLIKHFEGLYLDAYLCPAGVPTIGYGHTAGVRLGQRITAAGALSLLTEDMAEAAADVDRLVKVRINGNQRGALASFVFNLGAGNLGSSTLLKKLNAGDVESAAEEFGKWINASGRPLFGLIKRRAAERQLFLTGGAVLEHERHHPMAQLVDAPEGDERDRVRAIQAALGIRVDGAFGPKTREAVIAFQRRHGLAADGIVGPVTARAMGLES